MIRYFEIFSVLFYCQKTVNWKVFLKALYLTTIAYLYKVMITYYENLVSKRGSAIPVLLGFMTQALFSHLSHFFFFLQEGKIFVRVKINKEKQNTVEQKKKVDRWIRYFISDKRTRSTGSSLSYPAAQNIAQQDLYGGQYDEEVFTTPKSRILLKRLHKTTIKTEMNEDSKKKKKKRISLTMII